MSHILRLCLIFIAVLLVSLGSRDALVVECPKKVRPF